MKKLALGLLVFTGLVASAGHIHPMPSAQLRLAQTLNMELARFAMSSEQEARVAERRGNYLLARRLEDVAYQVNHLADDLQFGVVEPLRFGQLFEAARNLEGIQFEFQAATRSILALGRLPLYMQQTADRARFAHVQLKSLLGVRPF